MGGTDREEQYQGHRELDSAIQWYRGKGIPRMHLQLFLA